MKLTPPTRPHPPRRPPSAPRRALAHCSQLAAHLPQKVVSTNYDDSATKANVLLQAHFSRTKLPLELQADQSEVLLKLPRLLQACVNVISSNGWLKPALAAMELSQMATQGLWDRDSSLLQVLTD